LVRQTARTIILEVAGGICLLLLLAVAVLAFMLANGPVGLGLFKDDIEQALTNARDGRAVTLSEVFLEWSPSERRVELTANGIDLMNGAGERAASADRAEIVLDATSLVLGKVVPLEFHLRSGEMLLIETPDGWSIAGETPVKLSAGGTQAEMPATPAEWLSTINMGLQLSLVALKNAASQVDLEAVSFEEFKIIAATQGGGERFRVERANGKLERLETGTTLSLSALGGEGLPDTITLSVDSPPDFSRVDAEFGLAGWSLEALTDQFAVLEDQLFGDVAGIALRAGATAGGGLEGAALSLQPSKIAYKSETQDIAFERLGFEASYAITEDDIALNLTDLQHERLSGPIKINLSDVLSGEGARDYSISSPQLGINATPLFETAWELVKFESQGKIDFGQKQIAFDRLAFALEGAEFLASGKAALKEKRAETDLPFTTELTAKITGEVTPAMVVKYWPPELGAGARNFVRDSVLQGSATGGEVAVNIRQDSFSQGFLADESLLATFAATGAEVKFLEDLPSISAASGTGRLTGNSISIDLAEGMFGTWTLSEGTFELPAFNPKGGEYRVYGKGSGPVAEMVAMVFDTRLNLREKTGFTPEDLSGIGDMTIELFRPALDNVAYEKNRFTVTGRVREGGLKQTLYGFDMTGMSGRVDMDQNTLAVAGFGQLGPLPVQFTWRDTFTDAASPSSISASAIVDPDVLNRFGVLGRAYLTGEIPVEVQALANGRDLASADIALDLQGARIDVSEIGWVKPSGQPARASITYRPTEGRQSASAKLVAEDASFDGDLSLGKRNRIESADVRRLFLDGRADVSGTIRRAPSGALTVNLSGPFLDASEATAGLGGAGGSNGTGLKGDITLNADVDRLRVRDGFDVTGAKVSLVSATDGVKSFSASGQTITKDSIDIKYDNSQASRPATISIQSDNAGFLTEALIGSDVLEGGDISVTGTFAKADRPTQLLVDIRDSRLRDAPFLTQILSIASLRGLADNLAGEGVFFSRIEVPLTIAGGRYQISGGRAQGPAMGMTTNGWIATDGSGIRLDGVLVPSFGVNSALGGIPIIGDLFVSREGEGVFSITYGVRGSLEQAQVSVNPLSAITPGILRRIFEAPADTELPESDPNVAPPPAVEPLPPAEVID